MSKKILVFTTEMLPGLGYPTAGGGIRAWQIGEGLKSRGHEVIYSIPQMLAAGKNNLPESIQQYVHSNDQLNAVVDKAKPEIVVCIQWHHANKLQQLKVPLVLDLFGLLMLENVYFNEFNLELFTISKVEAFAKADYFICASDKQKAYFFTWMMLAGIDPKTEGIAAIPVSLSPELPQPEPPEELTFVFGGVFWPWQDPFTPLNEVIKQLDAFGKGKLKIYGSVHPYLQNVPLTYSNPEERLIKSPRMERYPMLQHEEMMQAYIQSTVAVDLMMPNNERFLAYPIRTVCYLWCGLPVLISDFCDVAMLVKEYRAGWVVNPNNPEEIKQTIKQIMDHSEQIAEYKRNAQRLVKERLTWDKTIEPLHQFCEQPFFLKKNTDMIKQNMLSLFALHKRLGEMGKEMEMMGKESERLATIEQERNQLKADLEAIRNKLLFRIYHRSKQLLKGKKK